MRHRHLLLAGVLALLGLALVLAAASGWGGAYSTFSDSGAGSASLSAATLAPPTYPSATLGGDGETVSLSWTASASTFTTSYDVWRGPSAGTYPTFATNVASTSTTDVPGAAITHYGIKSRYLTWSSVFSTPDVFVKPLDHFSVKASDGVSDISNQTAGTPFTVKASAQATDNSTVTVFTGSVALTATSGTISCSPSCTQTAVAGVATFDVTYTASVSGTSLTATGGSPTVRTGTSNTFDVIGAGSTFIESSTASSCTPAVGTTGHKLVTTTSAAVTLGSEAAAGTDVVYFAFTSDAGVPSLATWAAGSYTVELNVTDTAVRVSGYKVQLLRVSSSCGTPTVLATSVSQSGEGLKTFSFPSVSSSSGSVTDRFQVRVLVTTTSGGSNTTRRMEVRVNTTDSEVLAPW